MSVICGILSQVPSEEREEKIWVDRSSAPPPRWGRGWGEGERLRKQAPSAPPPLPPRCAGQEPKCLDGHGWPREAARRPLPRGERYVTVSSIALLPLQRAG